MYRSVFQSSQLQIQFVIWFQIFLNFWPFCKFLTNTIERAKQITMSKYGGLYVHHILCLHVYMFLFGQSEVVPGTDEARWMQTD